MSSESTVVENATPRRRLERARVDLSSTKTQMLLGSLIMVVSCLVAYGKTVLVTFLGQDLTHVQAIAEALHGAFDKVRSHPTSLLLIDYLLYHTNTLGFHVSNIAMTAACGVLVGLITLELTGRLGNRNGATSAIWAGLLFTVYPLHAQSVAIVSGRIEIMASLFYLTSVFCFLRYRLIEEKPYFPASIICAALALGLSAQSLSIALIITLLSFHPGRNPFAPHKNIWLDAATCSAPYWLIVALEMTIRPFYMGEIDKHTVVSLFFPINEAVARFNKIAPIALIPLLAAIIVLLLRSQLAKSRTGVRTARTPSSTMTALILVIWIIVTVPQLTLNDSHLFLAAAPFSILIAMLSLESGNTVDRTAKILTVSGLLAMTMLYCSWSYLLHINLRPTIQGSQIVENFRQQLVNIGTADQEIYLTNWPKIFNGVPLIGSPEKLKLFLAPPFIDRDLSSGVHIVQDLSALKTDNAGVTQGKIYQWQQEKGQLVKVEPQQPVGASSTSNLVWAAANKKYFDDILKNTDWQIFDSSPGQPWHAVDSNRPALSLLQSSARILTGKQAVIWLPDKIDKAALHDNRWIMRAAASGGDIEIVSRNWSDTGNQTDFDKKTDAKISVEGKRLGNYIFFDLRELEDYLFAAETKQIGLLIKPGTVTISNLEFVDTHLFSKDKNERH